jgi:hypothetical protein
MYRESAYNYAFVGDSISVTGPYVNFEEGNSILDDIDLWEDFARESRFQDFYNAHRPVYESMVNDAKKHLPVQQMWQWCERRFPNRYNTYRIIISPLVNGFHSTQKIESKAFNECIMFICGADGYDGYTKKEKEGLYSGIVFTEIDHNYINPVSDRYRSQLDQVFDNDIWIKKQSQAEGYGDGTGYFNEYFTHAVYLLYVQDYYSKSELATISKNRIDLMLWRGFPKFKEFYLHLKFLYEHNGAKDDLTLLYPELIKWASERAHD